MCVIDTNSERAIIWIFSYLLLVVVPFAVNDLAMFDQPPRKWTYRIFRALLYSFLWSLDFLIPCFEAFFLLARH